MNVEIFRTSSSFLKNQCYLLHEAGQGVLIDPAWDFPSIDLFLKTHRIDLRAVLVTHGHSDHTDLAGSFAAKYQCPVYMSSVEINHFRFRCPNLKAIDDGDPIDLGGFRAMALLTPGHSPGGMCYMIGDHMFTGDTVFIEGVGTCGDDEKAAGDLFDLGAKNQSMFEADNFLLARSQLREASWTRPQFFNGAQYIFSVNGAGAFREIPNPEKQA